LSYDRDDVFRLALVASLAACLPPDKVDGPNAAATDPDVAAIAHPWIVENHILGGTTTLTDGDAMRMHGRKVDISATGYKTPFQGTCDGADRDKRTRTFDDVGTDVDLGGERRMTAIRFGMTKTVTEYRLTCKSNPRTPPLTIYVAARRAMTCFSGVCYLLAFD
jgi:hypothetical protein